MKKRGIAMETTQLIEKYLEGNVSPAEKAEVEARASTDEEFRKLLELHREVNESISDKELFDLKNKIKAASDRYFSSAAKDQVYKSRYYFLRIAALVVLIAGSVLVFRHSSVKEPLNTRLYNRYYKSYKADIVTRSSDKNNVMANAIMDYNKREYGNALNILNSIIKDDPANYTAWFYRGLACMELEKYDDAVTSFIAIPAEWNSIYKEHKNWYLSLALLRSGNSESIQYFRLIYLGKGYYSEKAAKMVSELER